MSKEWKRWDVDCDCGGAVEILTKQGKVDGVQWGWEGDAARCVGECKATGSVRVYDSGTDGADISWGEPEEA